VILDFVRSVLQLDRYPELGEKELTLVLVREYGIRFVAAQHAVHQALEAYQSSTMPKSLFLSFIKARYGKMIAIE
jgi:hypothetical protein